MIQHQGLEAFVNFSRPAVIAVGVPLMIAAGIATYFNSRASISRQSPEAAANPQTALMNKLALYVFPLGVVVGGPFLPLAIIIYWFSNNIWTFGQQHYVFGKIAKEDEEKKEEQLARRAANAPAPGAKPTKPRKGGAAAAAATEVAGEITESAGSEESATEVSEADGGSADDVSSGGSTGGGKPRPGASPRPGARPQRKKKR
jgi:YidC/Oxa1 family membrane protein insertase